MLVAFIAAALSVLVLRRKEPHRERPFMTPWVPFVPIGAMGVCFCLILALPPATLLFSAVWVCVGLAIYAVYGKEALSRAQ